MIFRARGYRILASSVLTAELVYGLSAAFIAGMAFTNDWI
jgi:hypothetical protein